MSCQRVARPIREPLQRDPRAACWSPSSRTATPPRTRHHRRGIHHVLANYALLLFLFQSSNTRPPANKPHVCRWYAANDAYSSLAGSVRQCRVRPDLSVPGADCYPAPSSRRDFSKISAELILPFFATSNADTGRSTRPPPREAPASDIFASVKSWRGEKQTTRPVPGLGPRHQPIRETFSLSSYALAARPAAPHNHFQKQYVLCQFGLCFPLARLFPGHILASTADRHFTGTFSGAAASVCAPFHGRAVQSETIPAPSLLSSTDSIAEVASCFCEFKRPPRHSLKIDCLAWSARPRIACSSASRTPSVARTI